MTGEFLYRKTVDKSVLTHGITVPLKYHQQMYDKFGYIEKGTSIDLKVWIDNESFDITLLHVKFNVERSEVIQIRYSSSKSYLPKRLRDIFPFTTGYAKKCDEYKEIGMPTPKLNETEKEYIDIELVDDGFVFNCYPNGQNYEGCNVKEDPIDNPFKPPVKPPLPSESKPPVIPPPSVSPKPSVYSLDNKINGLIAKGRIRGFVKESEVMAVLPEGTSVDKIEEVFNNIISNNIELRWEE